MKLLKGNLVPPYNPIDINYEGLPGLLIATSQDMSFLETSRQETQQSISQSGSVRALSWL